MSGHNPCNAETTTKTLLAPPPILTSLHPIKTFSMAAPLLLRTVPLLRIRLSHRVRLAAGILSIHRRPWSYDVESVSSDEDASATEKPTAVLNGIEGTKNHRWNDPDYRKWKDMEEEIFRDIGPVIYITKEILRFDRYVDGERLMADDERVVKKRLLAYHPHCEDKIGCGLKYIMVDRHPQFRQSRCLFVVRTDGSWIDFSYQKCLREYLRDKYPSYAKRFIREHFKRT